MNFSCIYFLIFLNIYVTNGEDKEKNCEVDTSAAGVVKYVCPPSPCSTKTSIYVYSEQLTIFCNNTEVLNDTVLPRGNHNRIIKLILKQCPVPEKGIEDLVNRFNITSLKELTLELVSISNHSLKPEEVTGLVQNLTDLSIVSSNINYIPKRTFDKLFKLEKLMLRNNKIHSLPAGVLEGLKDLKDLDISFNEIGLIEVGIFRNVINLVNLSLEMNQLGNISRKIFENCENIERISLENNPNIILYDDVFSNFDKLREVNLANNRLESISENLFNGSVNLRVIYLNNNSLISLDNNYFKGLKYLVELHLDGNNIKSLHPQVFSSLRNLNKLYLQYNQIESLDEDLFKNMKNLIEVNLSHNQINFNSRSQILAFQDPHVKKLKEIDLSYNNISFYPDVLNNKKKMEKLNLNNNFIGKVQLMSMLARKVPGSRNLVIDLDLNNITSIELDQTDLNEKRKSITVITVTNNPIVCDCNALNLAMFLQVDHNLNRYVRFEPKELQCSGSMTGKILNEIELTELTCSIEKNCSSNRDCDCLRRSFDQSLIVNCSNRDLTDIPELISHELTKYNQIIVHLDGNRLNRSPGEHDGYANVTELYLQKNQISNVTWIPESLKVLNLSDNHISFISDHSLELLNRSIIEKLSLGYNPWRCNCEASKFAEYIRDHIKQVDSSQIRCTTTGKEMVKLNTNDLCTTNKKLILIVSIFIILLFILATSVTSLYLRYKKKILIWLYIHELCLCCIEVDELDKDKKYDAFISYSHKDEDFVFENLISILESGPRPYKLCFHTRDFIPGEYIQTQITNSILDSRRTIVVLSPSFLESVWGKLEFKTAHTEAMLEGRARVIVVIYGDVDLEGVDDDLKSHIKSNTYVKWNDPWFWKKLSYALPHSLKEIKDV